jgi:hypothetical protein
MSKLNFYKYCSFTMDKSTRRIRRESNEHKVRKQVDLPTITEPQKLSGKQLELSMEQCHIVPNTNIEGNDGKKKDAVPSIAKKPRQPSKLEELRKKAKEHNERCHFGRLIIRMQHPYPNSKPTEVYEAEHCPCCFRPMFDVAKKMSDIRHTLVCGHQLHSECLIKWFSVEGSQGVCPICRTPCH